MGQRLDTLSYILKQTWWCLFVCGDKQGKAGRPGQRLRGPGEVPFLLKKSLGKPGDLHLIKQKYKFLKKSNQIKIQIQILFFSL
jgi:hypothetical protein